MSYVDHVWETGEVITADNLNLISPYIVLITFDSDDSTYTTDKTAGEILTEAIKGRVIVFADIRGETTVMYQLVKSIVNQGEEGYLCTVDELGELGQYTAQTEDDYFVMTVSS